MVTYGLPILPLILALGPEEGAPEVVRVLEKLRGVVLLIIVQTVVLCACKASGGH